ncbi:dienelactone hydrolase family protein [Candidatus Palauibacter sp.]|uniref:dienelactone hydrolase family protein n=1 Tax=Candidatus Palauibacter sp. TaxID=3101350 RepID=UPI003D1328EC
MTTRKKASDFPQEVLALFDGYVHGFIHRRDFLEGAGKVLGSSAAAVGVLQALRPNYAWARHVARDDARIRQEYVTYPSPSGSGTMRGYLAVPAGATEPMPAVLVIHENRGLNRYIEDVVRRFAAADFVALGPDALTPLGGYPGNDDEGREMQRQLDRDVMMEDWIAAFGFLRDHEATTGRVGAVGFCYGGGVVNQLAVRLPDLGAGVPFYGSAPDVEDVPSIQAPLMIQLAGLDERINAAYPAYQEALEANGKDFAVHTYEGANHGFHNDTTPRYDEEAASLAQERTIAFFNEHLRG